jgi:hypothetical protein
MHDWAEVEDIVVGSADVVQAELIGLVGRWQVVENVLVRHSMA